MRKAALVLAECVISAFVALLGWYWLYPSTSDPKNLQYVLWKRDLYPLDVDIALGTMIGDSHRDSLVLGKSRKDLMQKFGYLVPGEQLQGGYREYFLRSGYSDVAVLRQSEWMVVFVEGKASKLVLLKGI